MVGVTILLTSHYLHVVQEVTGFVVTMVGFFGMQSFPFFFFVYDFTLSLVFSDLLAGVLCYLVFFSPLIFVLCVCLVIRV